MRLSFTMLLVGCSCLAASLTAWPTRAQGQATGVLPAAALQPCGRTRLNQQQLELISSAAHVGFSFEGTECRVYAVLPGGQDHNYLQYELDGVYQKRLRVAGGAAAPLVLMAPSGGKHTAWLYKATEAHTGAIAIQKITAQRVQALPVPAGPLIEFIGNSITCGALADASEVPCGTGAYHDQHNAYLAYGPRVARALQVSYVLSSVSGIGAYRNWNSAGPTMPQVYEKVDFQATTPMLWNFAAYSPRVVSIALGTNDLSAGDGKSPRLPFDSASFVNSYGQFVRLVKARYPKARLALLSSPMASGPNRTLLEHCLTAIKQQADASYPADPPVALHFFQPMQARGCNSHPSVEDHALLAKELEPFFRQLL
ncbi:SGNH/GDSL hydrolase family protein [Hymenobacter sp. RP-2-7]|uniref:SGNH/GDSL hydrolase family protein n=1 Tax=Hymenobacter polaris TaxID=2682546 RepID=A0A7Y0FPB5_9BACT|nr:SGNH/GDSL hydrolase family protein [Hymenobacter polaris]NML67872.1 SGNH/GDSL hydrolase family protein [Hymenobacter polaris]